MTRRLPSTGTLRLNRRPWPEREVLIIALWAATLAAMAAQWIWHPARPNLPALVALAALSYLAALVWRLSAMPPASLELPNLQPLILPGWGWRPMLSLVVAGLLGLFALEWAGNPGPGWPILSGSTALIGAGIAVAWRRRLTIKLIGWGLAASVVAGVAALPIGNSGPLGALLSALMTWPHFVAGALLLEHTGLGQVSWLRGRYALASCGFLWGSIAALPFALLNIAAGPAASDAWVDAWWKPMAALSPGIMEEVWARLFLTTLIYALLRPTTNERPQRALVAAILIAAVAHGIAHLPTAAVLSTATLNMALVGVIATAPMAMLMIKRDLEHAMGYHFFVDFVRFLAAFLLVRP